MKQLVIYRASNRKFCGYRTWRKIIPNAGAQEWRFLVGWSSVVRVK